jgi:hypothetical protein
MNSNIFICELSKENQKKVTELLRAYFIKEGFDKEEIEQLIINAMENRLWVLSEVIDIDPFIEEGKVIKLK